MVNDYPDWSRLQAALASALVRPEAIEEREAIRAVEHEEEERLNGASSSAHSFTRDTDGRQSYRSTTAGGNRSQHELAGLALLIPRAPARIGTIGGVPVKKES
jgi:hypothetical protein